MVPSVLPVLRRRREWCGWVGGWLGGGDGGRWSLPRKHPKTNVDVSKNKGGFTPPNHPFFHRGWIHYKASILGVFPLFLETPT